MAKSRDILPWGRERSRQYGPLGQLRHQMNRLFDTFFAEGNEGRIGFLEGRFAPEIDLTETDKEIRVSAELPGLEEKDIEVTMTDGALNIRGEKREEKTEEEKNYYRSERRYGSFERTIPLPAEIDSDKVQAEFKRGVLTVRIPKTPGAESRRKKIDVKPG